MTTKEKEEAIVDRILFIPLDKWDKDRENITCFSTKLNGKKIYLYGLTNWLNNSVYLIIDDEIFASDKLLKLLDDLLEMSVRRQKNEYKLKIEKLYNIIIT